RSKATHAADDVASSHVSRAGIEPGDRGWSGCLAARLSVRRPRLHLDPFCPIALRSSPKEATRQPNLLSAVPNTCARSCEVFAPVGLLCSGLCSVVFGLTSRPDTLNFTACAASGQGGISTNHPSGVDQRRK